MKINTKHKNYLWLPRNDLKKIFFIKKILYEIYSEISNGAATRLTSLVDHTATYLVWVDYLTLNEQ